MVLFKMNSVTPSIFLLVFLSSFICFLHAVIENRLYFINFVKLLKLSTPLQSNFNCAKSHTPPFVKRSTRILIHVLKHRHVYCLLE